MKKRIGLFNKRFAHETGLKLNSISIKRLRLKIKDPAKMTTDESVEYYLGGHKRPNAILVKINILFLLIYRRFVKIIKWVVDKRK